jgi:hypothetical protein
MTVKVWLTAYRRDDGVLVDATELTRHGLARVAAILDYLEQDLAHSFGLDDRELAALAELAGVAVDTEHYIYLMQGTADGGQPGPVAWDVRNPYGDEDDEDDDEPDPNRIPPDMGVQLIWFNLADDRYVDGADITSLGRERIAEIVGIPFAYLLYSNPVENEALSTLAELAGIVVDPTRYRYFVEGFANSR